MKEGEKFPEFGPFLCWHKWSCSTITEVRRDFWRVGLNGLQILAGLLPSPGTEQGQRPTFLAVPPRDSAAVLYSTTTDDPWSLLCPGFCVPGTAPQGQTHPKHSQRGLGIVSRSWDSTKRHRGHSWGWLHPKGIPGAWGRVRQPQREDHREKLIFSLQIYLSWLVVELWGNTQTHSVLSALILRSDNSFFMYWSIINQIYLEGQHDPIQADPGSPCAIPGTMSFISQSLWLSFSLSLLSPQTSPCSHFQPHKRPGLDLNSKTKNLEVPALGIPNQHFFTPCSYTHWHLPLAEFASQNTN